MALKKERRISKIRKLLKEEELEKDVREEGEEDEKLRDDERNEARKARLSLTRKLRQEEEDEGDVESDEDENKDLEDEEFAAEAEAEDDDDSDSDDEEEAPKDEEEAYAAEAEDDDVPADEEEPEAEKEFDINDESDVFLDDEEEKAAKAQEESDDSDEDDEEENDKEVEENDDADSDDEEEKEPSEACEDDDEDKEKVEENDDEDEDDEEEPKKPSLDVEEHVKALFNGESLSEEFQKKAKTIFEAAVRQKVLEYAKSMKFKANKKIRAAKKSIQERLVTKIDGYMDYVVEEYMETNKLAIEHGLRNELTEEFVSDLRNLFEAHNIMIPKGKENLVESLSKKVEETKKERDEEIKKNLGLKKKLNEYKKNEALRLVCEGLAETEIEKLKTLASNIQYDEKYQDKLNTLKDSYFSQRPKKTDSIEKLSDKKESEVENSPDMQAYLFALKGLKS